MKSFKLADKITVSEFQRILMFLDGYCDYQVALKTMRDVLGATKEKNRYWILSHAEVWRYLEMKLPAASCGVSKLYSLRSLEFFYAASCGELTLRD